MSAITLAQAQQQLDNWLSLLTKLSQSTAQLVIHNDRHYSAKDINTVQA